MTLPVAGNELFGFLLKEIIGGGLWEHFAPSLLRTSKFWLVEHSLFPSWLRKDGFMRVGGRPPR